MSDHDLLAGVIAGKLRLLPDVQQLYPPRPALTQPARSVTALITEIADEPAVVITGTEPLEIEASIGITISSRAVHAGREAVASILTSLPAGSTAHIRVRIAAID